MSAFPSLPLYTDAFIADTMHLSAQETGAYAMLLMIAWRSPGCRLPDDDAKLARYARVDLRTWRKIKPTVMEFWALADGFWTQKRLSKEHEIVSKRAEVARENGKHGGRPKPLGNNDGDNPAGSSRGTQKKAPISISTSKDKTTHTERARATAFPEGFEPNETDLACFAEQGITDPAEQAKTIAHWRDHHVGKGNTFKDWHASLRTWLRSPLRVQQPARPPPVNGHPTQRSLTLVNGNRPHVQAAKPSVLDVLKSRIAAREAG